MGLKNLLKPVSDAGQAVGSGVGKAASAVNPLSGMKAEFQGAAAQAGEQIALFANLTLLLLLIIAVASAITAFVAIKYYLKNR